MLFAPCILCCFTMYFMSFEACIFCCLHHVFYVVCAVYFIVFAPHKELLILMDVEVNIPCLYENRLPEGKPSASKCRGQHKL